MTENSAAIRELFTRLRDLDVRAKRAGDAAGFLDQMVRLAQGGFRGTATVGPCGAGFVETGLGVGNDFACIPTVMPFLWRTFAGSPLPFGELTWTGSSLTDSSGVWRGCVLYPRPATTGCGARTIPLWFTLDPNGDLSAVDSYTTKVEWIMTSGTCPDTGKSCADYGSVTHSATGGVFDAFDDGTGGLQFRADLQSVPASVTGFASGAALDINGDINGNYFADSSIQWLPSTFDLVDSLYGTQSMVWDGVKWTGCHAGISYPGFGACAARTLAIKYNFDPDGSDLTLNWLVSGFCPSASTCASTMNISYQPSVDSGTHTSVVWKYDDATAPTAHIRNLYRHITSTFTWTA